MATLFACIPVQAGTRDYVARLVVRSYPNINRDLQDHQVILSGRTRSSHDLFRRRPFPGTGQDRRQSLKSNVPNNIVAMGPRNDPSAGNKATGARLFRRQPMDSWRNDPGDRMQYWIAHGGGRSATASASIPNPVSALRSPSPTASITSSVKADSGIGISSVSESGAATQVVHDVPRSCLERAISIRDDLAADTGSNDAIAVPTHIRDSIRDLTLDLVPNTPSQHPIFPQGSTSSRGSASEHRRSSSSFGSSRSKKQGKRPARDCDNTYGSRCEPLTQVQETNEKAKKPGLRCFYHFAPEPNDRCGCNQRFISRLM